MGEISAGQLHYVEVMCESALYGAYAVLVMVVIWILMSNRSMPMIHKIMFGTGIVMFMLATAHLGLVIQQVTVPVVPIQNAQAQVSIATIQFMLGDSILIWRVWVVWGHNIWVATVPVLTMLASAGVRFALVGNLAGVQQFSSNIASALIVANTGLCTLLIAGRIWYLQYQTSRVLGSAPSRPSHSAYRGILLLLIESGALYAISQLLGLILDDVNNPGVHTVLDLQIPLIGILPTLIVVLVHFDLVPGSHSNQKYTASMKGLRGANGHGHPGASSMNKGRSQQTATAVTLNSEQEVTRGRLEMQEEWKLANTSQWSVDHSSRV